MIKLELTLTNLDFDALVDLYLPQLSEKFKREGNPLGTLMSPGMVKTMLRTMNQQKKEKLAAELINGNSDRICRMFEESAAKRGIQFKISDAKASAE